MNIVTDIHEGLLSEARASPALLADVARLEAYVSETYAARSFVELLQNADDAGAMRFKARLLGESLLCANDGRIFESADLIGLCRSGASTKTRGSAIGYRGIGFKSVVSLATRVHLVSGDVRCTFARDLLAGTLGVAQANVPLVRVPYPFTPPSDSMVVAAIEQLIAEGFSTVFVLEGCDARKVAADAAALTPDCLTFLRAIKSVSLAVGSHSSHFGCERVARPQGGRMVRLEWAAQFEDWEVISSAGVELAFALRDGRRVPAKPEAALVFAYLPSLEATGLGVRLNADFSTDPSRTRIVLDDATTLLVDAAARLVADLIEEALSSGPDGADTLACLAATFDLATLEFLRPSFRTALVRALRHAAYGQAARVVLQPSWLNRGDYRRIVEAAEACMVPDLVVGHDESHVVATLRYLGARSADEEMLAAGVRSGVLSNQGRAEVAAYAIRSAELGVAAAKPLLDVPGLWEAPQGATTVREAMAGRIAPTSAFEGRLRVAGLPPNRLDLLRSSRQGEPSTTRAEAPADPFGVRAAGEEAWPAGMAAWRSAETVVADLLRAHGYEVEDCSRQNVGYDLRARKDGKERLVEVKLISRPGEPFILTSNEEAVARQAAANYYVALVRNLGKSVELMMLSDPANTLPLERQCRQWVWECGRYAYQPTRYGP